MIALVEKFNRWTSKHLVEHRETPALWEPKCAHWGHNWRLQWQCPRCGITADRLNEDPQTVWVEWKGREVQFLYEVPGTPAAGGIELAMILHEGKRNIVRLRDIHPLPSNIYPEENQ